MASAPHKKTKHSVFQHVSVNAVAPPAVDFDLVNDCLHSVCGFDGLGGGKFPSHRISQFTFGGFGSNSFASGPQRFPASRSERILAQQS